MEDAVDHPAVGARRLHRLGLELKKLGLETKI